MKKIFNLSFVQDFVKNKGFCLSKEYINSNTIMRWKCKCGYEWNAIFKVIKSGSWCKQCSDNRKKQSLKNIKNFVKKKHDGKCLSRKYVNNCQKLKWKCKYNHVWESTWHTIRRNWCPFCSGQNRTTKQEILNIIGNKGIILKGDCNSVDERITLKCNCGYIWETNVRSIKTKRWCPKCGNKIGPTIEEINEVIKNKGVCLKKEKSTKESTFKCNRCGNIFKQRYSIILGGSWCQKCSSKINKIDINIVNDLVVKNKGKLLTNFYKNSKSKLQIKCENNHVFLTNWNNLKDGNWCKYCSEHKGENLTRIILENLFNEKFEKCKPDWLINSKTNQKLELDGYCEKLNIAFEYQGRQHFSVVGSFKMTKKTLSQQQYRDQIKREICKKKGITLIEVKQFSKIKYKHITKNIQEAFFNNNIFINKTILEKTILKYCEN